MHAGETMHCKPCYNRVTRNDIWVTLDQIHVYVDGLVQERRNSSVLARELRLSYINPSMCPSM